MNIILGWDNSRDGIILFVFRNWRRGFYIGYWKLILEIREWIWVLIYFFFSYILNKYKNLFVFCYCIWFRKRDVCFILFLLIVFLLNFFMLWERKFVFM